MSRLTFRSVVLAAAVVAAAPAVRAETVALGSFAHVDLERNDPDTSASIATLLQAALGDTPGRTFVERQEAQKLIDELGLAALGESDPESASRIGRLLRADVMLTGTFVTPGGAKPFVVLDTTELARAEPLGQARVELDHVLERGRLVVPGREDMGKITAAAGTLLNESRDRLTAGRGLISIKFLGFAHDERDRRLASTESQLAAAIDSAAAATGKHRVLSLERTDVATQESEFALLGLAEADSQAYAKVADYFVWGSATGAQASPQAARMPPGAVAGGPAPTLSIKIWDGRHAPVEFREPLNLGAPRESAASLAAKVVDAAVAVQADKAAGPALGKGIARVFLEHERLLEAGARAFEFPEAAAALRLQEERFLSGAVFFYPASSEAWLRLQRIRTPPLVTAGRVSDIKREVQAVQFTLEVAKRFLVAPNGSIDPTPLDQFYGTQSLMYEDRFNRLKWQAAMIEEDFHDIYLSHNLDAVLERLSADYRTGVMQLCRELALAAPGQEDNYRRSASALLFTILENDFPKADRVAAMSALAPRLKVALLVHRAWYPTGDRLEALEAPLRAELIDEGKQADADSFDALSPDELAQAERSEAAPGSPAADKLVLISMEERSLANMRAAPSAAAMAAPIQAALGRIAALRADADGLRKRAVLFLESHATGWTWAPAMSASLLAGPLDQQIALFNPPLESLPAEQRAQAIAWLRQEAATVGSQGYPPEIAEALKAKADTVEAAPEPAPAPALRRSSAMPKYMDPKVGSWTLGDFGRRGDVASIDALFKEGVPVAYGGSAFFDAVRGEQWPAAYFILDSGYNPAAPWPIRAYASISDTFSPDTPGRLALAAAIAAGRQDLTDLLLQKGVRFGADGAAAGRVIHTLAMRRASGALRQVLGAGGRAGGPILQDEKQPLYYAVHYRDAAVLEVLLELGCNSTSLIETTALTQMKAANFQQWVARDPYANSALGLAAKTNWLEGSRIMLDKDLKNIGSALSNARLDRYATEPAVRALFVHAELKHVPIRRGGGGDAGIALFTAIAARDSPAFESALAAPGALLFRGFMGETALMFAIEEKETAFAGRLIDAGDPVDATDYNGSTPLCYAAHGDDAEIVEALVRHGASPNGRGGSVASPLEEAIDGARDPKLALRLVELGASLLPDPSRENGNPLFRAVLEDMPDLATKLMALGADPLRTAEGYTLVFAAARSNDPDMIQLVCDKGCDPNRRAQNGWTPLTSAVRWGAAESVRKLLQLGVRDPHAAAVSVSMVTDLEPPERPPPEQLRRLPYAPDYQRCVEVMEEFGQLDQSHEAQDSIFWHRSHTVAEIEAHLAAGGNVNFVGAISPLQAVLVSLDAAKVQVLLAHGADPNLAGPGNRTPLEMALGAPDILRMLLDHGAGPNPANTRWGGGALWSAVNDDNVPLDSVRILVNAGATLGIGGEETLAMLGKRNPARADAVRKILSGG